MNKRDRNKVKAIAKVYIRNGMDLKQAVETIEGKKTYSDNYLNVKVNRLKYSPEYIEAVKREIATFDKSLVNENFVLVNLYELISDKNIKASDKVNALNLCSKILQMTREGQQTTNIIVPNLANDLASINVKSMPKVEQHNELIVSSNTQTIANATLTTIA